MIESSSVTSPAIPVAPVLNTTHLPRTGLRRTKGRWLHKTNHKGNPAASGQKKGLPRGKAFSLTFTKVTSPCSLLQTLGDLQSFPNQEKK